MVSLFIKHRYAGKNPGPNIPYLMLFPDGLKKTFFDGREFKSQEDVKPQGAKYERWQSATTKTAALFEV